MDLEILDNIQRRILTFLDSVPEVKSFYLTGGTALSAFYLHHRKSRDLDLFTSEEELILPFSFKAEERLKKEGFKIERIRGLDSFIELALSSTEESTILHIALDTPFRLEPLRDSEEFNRLKIDSLLDIAANKLLALLGRANLRDFIDIYFLINKGFQKKELIDNAKKKDPGFDMYWFGTALERINKFHSDSPEMLFLMKPCTHDQLREFFNQWKGEIFKEITQG